MSAIFAISGPIPKPERLPKPAIKVMADGREICDLRTKAGRDEYRKRTVAMWERQDYRCAICGKSLPWGSTTFDHEEGRGFNGGHRDDRIEVDGVWLNAAAHFFCNAERGSKRTPYVITQEARLGNS